MIEDGQIRRLIIFDRNNDIVGAVARADIAIESGKQEEKAAVLEGFDPSSRYRSRHDCALLRGDAAG